jgi:hypothetical protein
MTLTLDPIGLDLQYSNVPAPHQHYEQVKSPQLQSVIEHTRTPEHHINTSMMKTEEISSNNNNNNNNNSNTNNNNNNNSSANNLNNSSLTIDDRNTTRFVGKYQDSRFCKGKFETQNWLELWSKKM